MSDNRKSYYLKLKENYFDEDAIVLLESMQDGTPWFPSRGWTWPTSCTMP